MPFRTRSIWFWSVHVHCFFGKRWDFLVSVTERRRIPGHTTTPRAWPGHVPGRPVSADDCKRYQKLGYGHVASTHSTPWRFADHRVHARVLQLGPANRMGGRSTSHINQHHGRKYIARCLANTVICSQSDKIWLASYRRYFKFRAMKRLKIV